MEALWTWLNSAPGYEDVLDPFGLVFLTVFAIGFLASAYLAGPGGKDVTRHDVSAEAIHRWATVGLWIFGPGLFFFAIRALQINPLSFGEPIWLVACLIALIVAVIRFADWWRKVHRARQDSHAHLFDAPRPTRQQLPPRPPQWERGAGG